MSGPKKMRENVLDPVQFGLEWPESMTEEQAMAAAREMLESEDTAVGTFEKEDDGVYLVEVDSIFCAKLEGAGEWSSELRGVKLSAEWP